MRVIRAPRSRWSDHDAGAEAARSAIRRLREDGARRWRDSVAARELEGSLISLAALVGTEVKDSADRPVGRLRDVVVHWTRGAAHPVVTAIVVRAGGHDILIGAHSTELSPPSTVRLRSPAVHARAAQRHAGDVALAHDVLDRQVLSADGLDVVRPADVYLAAVGDRVELVGIEVGVRALLRRLGPRRLRGRVRPGRVIDWKTMRSFSLARDDTTRRRGRRSELAGRAGAGLRLDVPAGELSELRASEVEAKLRAARDESERPSP